MNKLKGSCVLSGYPYFCAFLNEPFLLDISDDNLCSSKKDMSRKI